MTILATATRGRLAVQCDVCAPPMLTVNTPDGLRRMGWELSDNAQEMDICHLCAPRPGKQRRRGDREPVDPNPTAMPNLVVIGAMKAGTTSLHSYLSQHPAIAGSRDKEPRFFTDPACSTWVGAYQSQWVPGTAYRLESTPRYSKWPIHPGVPERMAAMVPDAKLIYAVRDPIDRIVAEYTEAAAWRGTSLSLEEELADADDPLNWLVASSRYATQLRQFLRHYSSDSIKTIDLSELATRPHDVLNEIFEFLGLAPIDLTTASLKPQNTRADKAAFASWLYAIRRTPLLGLYRALPERLRQLVITAAFRFRKQVHTPELSSESRQRLREILQPEIDDLRELTGLPLAAWDW